MQLQVKDVIKEILGLCGAIEIDETPTDSDMQLGMRRLNIMLDSWSSKRLLLRSQTQISFTIAPPKYVYTIGPTGDIVSAKPINIRGAYTRDGSGVDYPINIISTQELDSMNDKSFAVARPESLNYNPGKAQGATLGTFTFYCIPDQSYTAYVECDIYLTEFSALTDIVTFEPMYYEALVYNGAKRLWRNYHVSTPVPADIDQIANESLKSISVVNYEKIMANLDVPGSKSANFNIYTGDYN